MFEHHNNRYRARRSCYIEKTNSDDLQEQGGELALQINQKLVKPPELPEDKIGQVLPNSLHRYFFFDGERIDRMAKSENKSEIAKAIKTLLSVEVLDRAINHLKEARRSLDKELAEIGDPETKRLIETKNNLLAERVELESQREAIAIEISDQQYLQKQTSTALRNSDQIGQIQARRDNLKQQVEEIQAQLERSEEKLRRTISARGYTVFLTDAIAQFRSLSDELRQRGELPAGIKQQFVEDLLDEESCICGTPLKSGTKARTQVESWLDRSGIQDVEEAVIRMSGEVSSIERQIPEFWAEVEQEQASIENLRRHLSTLETQLDDIREQLKGSEDVNVQGFEQRLEEIENKIIELHREDENAARDIDEIDAEVANLNKQIKELKAKSKQQAQIKRQIAVTEDAIDRIEEVRRRVDQATKTQWRGEVETEMAPYIGKEYVLVFNSAKSDIQPDSIELDGETFPLVRQSPNAFEYTEVLEVDRRGSNG